MTVPIGKCRRGSRLGGAARCWVAIRRTLLLGPMAHRAGLLERAEAKALPSEVPVGERRVGAQRARGPQRLLQQGPGDRRPRRGAKPPSGQTLGVLRPRPANPSRGQRPLHNRAHGAVQLPVDADRLRLRRATHSGKDSSRDGRSQPPSDNNAILRRRAHIATQRLLCRRGPFCPAPTNHWGTVSLPGVLPEVRYNRRSRHNQRGTPPLAHRSPHLAQGPCRRRETRVQQGERARLRKAVLTPSVAAFSRAVRGRNGFQLPARVRLQHGGTQGPQDLGCAVARGGPATRVRGVHRHPLAS